MSCSLNERLGSALEEEVATQNNVGFAQLLLCTGKVKFEVERADKFRNRVRVLVALLPDDAYQILELLLILRAPSRNILCANRAVPAADDGSGEVTQQPRAAGLDGVDVCRGEEELDQGVARWLVVEEWEERPVEKPCAVLELCERRAEESSIDGLANLCDFLHGVLPVGLQDFAGKLTPCRLARAVVVCGLFHLCEQGPRVSQTPRLTKRRNWKSRSAAPS